VSFCTISRRCELEKTPSITFTLISGIPYPLFAFPTLHRSAPMVVNRPGHIHASDTPEPLHPYHYGFQQVEYRPAKVKRAFHARAMRQRRWPGVGDGLFLGGIRRTSGRIPVGRPDQSVGKSSAMSSSHAG
jgi:hypothetical protein